MVSLIKHWILHKELVRLSLLKSFDQVSPKQVMEVLEKFAVLRVAGIDRARIYSALVFNRKEIYRAPVHRAAVLRIWDLAKERYQLDLVQRSNWHKVMATCNAMYEPYYEFSGVQAERALAA